MSEQIEHRPTAISWAIGLIAIVMATIVLAAGELIGGLLAGFAGLIFLIAVGRSDRSVFNIGIAVLVLALIAAAITPTPPTSVLVATILAVIAWDQFETAFTLGEQIGVNQPTARLEIFNAGTTALVGAIGGGIIYIGFLLIPTGWPLTAIIVMLIAALFVLLAIEY